MALGDEYHFYDLINSADKEIMGRVEFIKLGIERARKQLVDLEKVNWMLNGLK